MNYKAMYKSELAEAAGVTPETFRRWLQTDKEMLRDMRVSPRQRLLPPQVVAYICEKYCINLS